MATENNTRTLTGAHPETRPDSGPDAGTEEAAAVASSAPSILALGMHLAAVHRAYEAQELGGREAANGPTVLARSNAMEILDARRDAIRGLIYTMPARTIQDAAVQVEAGAALAGELAASTMEA